MNWQKNSKTRSFAPADSAEHSEFVNVRISFPLHRVLPAKEVQDGES